MRCHVTAKNEATDHFVTGKVLAIVDTACTKAVAGHDWFKKYSDMLAFRTSLSVRNFSVLALRLSSLGCL